MHDPFHSFGEAAKNYPGLPPLRVVLVAVLVAAVIADALLFYPRGPSPDEWATRLAQEIVVDGTTYGNEPEAAEAMPRIQAAVSAWKEDSGCRLVGGTGIRKDTRAEVQAVVDDALAEARSRVEDGTFGVGTFGVGSAVKYRGKTHGDYGGAVIVADCTKQSSAPGFGIPGGTR